MTNDAAGLQKKSTAPTTSSGSATRPSGMRASSGLARRRVGEPVRAHVAAHDGRRDAVDGDAVRRQLDRVLLDQHRPARPWSRSRRSSRGRACRAARAPRAGAPGGPAGRPAATAAIWWRAAAWLMNIAAFRLTCTTSSKAASLTSAWRSSRWMPTQLTSRSRPPKRVGDGVDRPRGCCRWNARPWRRRSRRGRPRAALRRAPRPWRRCGRRRRRARRPARAPRRSRAPMPP